MSYAEDMGYDAFDGYDFHQDAKEYWDGNQNKMNDRLRFRVWDQRLNRYLGEYDPIQMIMSNGNLAYLDDYGMKFYEVEQCTGLKDRNGRLIYAGDILGNKDFMSDVALLKYNNEKCCYILERQNVDDHFNKWWADRLMVIGNIHENKELLK